MTTRLIIQKKQRPNKIRSGIRIKGPNIEKALPSWHDVKSQIKPNKAKERIAIAYHEAGHAVIARKLGITVIYVTVLGNAGAQTGSAAYLARNDGRASQLAAITKDILVCFAGPHAQHRHTPQALTPDEWEGDREVASRLSMTATLINDGIELDNDHKITPSADQLIFYETFFQRCLKESRQLVDENWSTIETVAEALLARHNLTGDDLDELILAGR